MIKIPTLSYTDQTLENKVLALGSLDLCSKSILYRISFLTKK